LAKGGLSHSNTTPTHINTKVATRALEEFQSYFLERRGDQNIPWCFLKEAQWFDKPDGDRYYCHYNNEGWKPVKFNFKFLVWVNVCVKDQPYLVWQIAEGKLEITKEE